MLIVHNIIGNIGVYVFNSLTSIDEDDTGRLHVKQVGAYGSVLSASISLHSRTEQVVTKDLDTHPSFAVPNGGSLILASCLFHKVMRIL